MAPPAKEHPTLDASTSTIARGTSTQTRPKQLNVSEFLLFSRKLQVKRLCVLRDGRLPAGGASTKVFPCVLHAGHPTFR